MNNEQYSSIDMKYTNLEESEQKDGFHMKIDLRSIIKTGVRFLLVQNYRKYPESIHYLTFPCLTPSGIKYQTHPTNFFQRMLVLDSLLDCAHFDDHITKQIVEKEITVILQAKHRIVRGGWSYIPSLPELPPDADDLGLVLQLLARTGGKKLAAVCDGALDVLFKYQTHPDGSFDLWVIDPSDTSQSAIVIRDYIKVIGGRGASPDVVSNVLWGLILYDKDLFQQEIDDGIRYLESCQTNDGFWESKWYWGKLYATYRALTVLNVIAPKSESIIRAQRFIIDAQNDDGGWGDNISNPLETAFALLSLSLKPTFHENILKGITYLVQSQVEDETWERFPFIKLKTIDGIKLYGSRTITTSFCIQALARIISTHSELTFITVKVDDLPYKRQIGDLTVRSNDNWQWSLLKNNELLLRNSSCIVDKPSFPEDFTKKVPMLHIIELSDKCNQTCAYCAPSAQYSDVVNLDNDYNILNKIVDFIVKYSGFNFCVEFQGGEALMNFPALQYIVEEITIKAIKLNKKPEFRLVSNLTLLTSDIADYIALMNIDVSTSLDGLEYLHNKYRKFPEGNNSYTKVVEGITQLRQRGVNVGVLMVVTRDALEVPEDIIDNFVKLGIYSFVLNPVSQVGSAEKSWDILGLDPDSYGYFWKRLLKRCFAYHLQNIPILDKTTDLLLRKIMMVEEPGYVDLQSPCGSVYGQITYDLHGNIYPCDEARSNQKIILGNVLQHSFVEISHHQDALKIFNASIINQDRCGLCAYRPWCGRCPVINKFQFGKYDVPSEKTYNCHIWKGLFDRFFELLAEDPDNIRFAARMITFNDIVSSYPNKKFSDKKLFCYSENK